MSIRQVLDRLPYIARATMRVLRDDLNWIEKEDYFVKGPRYSTYTDSKSGIAASRLAQTRSVVEKPAPANAGSRSVWSNPEYFATKSFIKLHQGHRDRDSLERPA